MSDSATPWTVAHQDPLNMGFSRKEYWRGCHFLLQGIFLTQEDQAQVSYIAGRYFTIWATGKFLENTPGHFNIQSWWICDVWKDVYFLPGLSWIWLLVQRSDVGVGLWLCSGLRLNAVLTVLQARDLYNNNMSAMPTWKGWKAMWSMTVVGPTDSVLSM